MLASVLSTFSFSPSNDPGEARRASMRRDGDKCVCMIDGMPYPVENWSMGGLLIRADSRMFTVDQNVDMVLKFKKRGDVVEIPVSGEVVRRTPQGIAMKFVGIGKAARHAMKNIISDVVTLQFAESQSKLT